MWLAKLRPGTTLSQAQAELDAVSAQLALAHPRTNEDMRAFAMPLRTHLAGGPIAPCSCSGVGAALILVLALRTVANLLFSLLAARLQEFAVRTALGARPRASGEAGADRERGDRMRCRDRWNRGLVVDGHTDPRGQSGDVTCHRRGLDQPHGARVCDRRRPDRRDGLVDAADSGGHESECHAGFARLARLAHGIGRAAPGSRPRSWSSRFRSR